MTTLQLPSHVEGKVIPKRLRELHEAVKAAGWRCGVSFGHDSAGHLFVTLEAIDPAEPVHSLKASWHTRATGGRTLRLFSCMIRAPYRGWRDVTASAALAEVVR